MRGVLLPWLNQKPMTLIKGKTLMCDAPFKNRANMAHARDRLEKEVNRSTGL